MEDLTTIATKIKTYLKENNLSNFTIPEAEEKYKYLYEHFSPEILKKLDGKEARDKLFIHDGTRDNLCYLIERSKEYGGFCGGIGGGSAYKFYLFKKNTGQWTAGSSRKNRILSEEESIEIAVNIRDAIVNGAKIIQESNFNSADDFVKLGKKLKEIFKNTHINPTNSWIHKYYSIMFPDIIPNCHQDHMKKEMIKKFHMEPLNDFWANDGQFYLLSKEAGIKLYSLFDEQIVGLFYKWDNHMWTDDFDKHNLVGVENIKYWAFTPGIRADRAFLCYENAAMAMGWNYLGDLSKYEDNFEEKVGDKIKRKENKKVKPTSAIRSLSGIYRDIKAGDIICIRRGLTNIIAIGKVTGESRYFYDSTIDKTPDDAFYHFRDGIRWLKLDKEYELKGPKFLRDTLYELSDERIIKILRQLADEIPEDKLPEKEKVIDSSLSRNIIYFGAPGTGKSYTLNKDMEELITDDDNYERVTFHPDYAYANFVGTYKPVSTENGISYDYVPGPFMRTLVKAYRNPNVNYLLVIEEINRANVAAAFGDVFQLLDRNKDGSSRYPIETSEDIRKYLKKELQKDYKKISIPSNMFIWATMNSADQGVFPMDTAFKRRWTFRYFGIDNNEELIEDLVVNLNGRDISWNELRKAINDELLNYKINEDKLLGPFFAFDEYVGTTIPIDEFMDTFKNKILMYLFEDVARSKRNILFSGVKGNGNNIYSRICDEFDQKGVEIFCNNISDQFIDEYGE